VTEFGLFIRLEAGVDALVRSSEIQVERSIFSDRDFGRENPNKFLAAYKEGDSVTATVLKINKKDRKIELSIRRYERGQEKELLKKYSGNKGNPTLGEATGWGEETEE